MGKLAKVICEDCGKVFNGGPKACFCPECRAERVKVAARERAKRMNLSALGVAAKKKASEEAQNNGEAKP